MKFIADFHIHSHYSIATSKQLTPEHLDYWARIKGIKIVGTGDFTHPGWIQELKEKIEPAEPGLFRLKNEFRISGDIPVPVTEENEVRFVLTAEISNIYKKGDKTRKVHNVIFAPDFETVNRIQDSLRRHDFNITSDGRPILGLDSRDLLEMCLEASDQIFFVPAHIWTPWFSALGSKSGFDSIEACYGNLSEHIYAVETGLSSDPAMNWLCSFLDRYTLISNSDAHSPEKLGREGNRFNTDISYFSIVEAIKKADGNTFQGTLEFFPQEGKYHLDGHRKCGISWDPGETKKHKGICPVCGKKITVGVMHRVMELADRSDPTEHAGLPFHSLIPLKEILAEIFGVGANSKQVVRSYNHLIQKMGSEFRMLLDLPIDDIKHAGNDLLAEGVRRMRNREVLLQPGYDGEYGVILVFGDDLKNGFGSQKALFQDLTATGSKKKSDAPRGLLGPVIGRASVPPKKISETRTPEQKILKPKTMDLNPQQQKAAQHDAGPALILAGPGTGKTRVLTRRIAHLIQDRQVHPENILAVTFTNKAAEEMRGRLKNLLSEKKVSALTISTFHAFGYNLLKTYSRQFGRRENFGIIDIEDKNDILKNIVNDHSDIPECAAAITDQKQNLYNGKLSAPDIGQCFEMYETFLKRSNLFDLDDLISKPVLLFREHPEILNQYQKKYTWILVDEYQDINRAQYALIQQLAPGSGANLFVIGDPNQAIYGFRGANAEYIRKFKTDYPDTMIYLLNTSYRCSAPILNASSNILNSQPDVSLKSLNEGVKIQIVKNRSDKSEAEFIARTIETLMGGLRFFSMDSDITAGHEEIDMSLSDFAVLCRTGRQLPVIEKAFHDHGIPFQAIGEEPFFKQKSVRMVVDLLRWSQNPENPCLEKHITTFIQADDKILNNLTQCSSLKEKFRFMQQHYFGDNRLKIKPDIWKKLINLGEPYGENISGFLKLIALGMPVDTYQPDIERVALMTLHAAKGLEFPVVFIAGCEDGLLPYHLWGKISDMDEERRLLYVGMTRAKTRLFLTHAEKRLIMGQTLKPERSPFLDFIEKEWMELKQAKSGKEQKKRDHQMGLFE
ncbi:UvrD-helicase domain-containing protein [bacterium]|nr:UvrD-helicase domain-containing protein [bacterium]